MYYPNQLRPTIPTETSANGGIRLYGSITLLFWWPGQPDLEILISDTKWAPVPVHPGDPAGFPFPTILVNIGDMLRYWTDELLKSTDHELHFPIRLLRGELTDERRLWHRLLLSAH